MIKLVCKCDNCGRELEIDYNDKRFELSLDNCYSDFGVEKEQFLEELEKQIGWKFYIEQYNSLTNEWNILKLTLCYECMRSND